MNQEQINLFSENNSETGLENKKETPSKISKLEENDECQNCGNIFYSGGSCQACSGHKEKIQFLKENKEGKHL